MKAYFFRKPTPEEIYPTTEFAIKKVVRLTKDEFKDLLANPLADRDYVKDNSKLMYQDDSGLMHCIYVIADGYAYGILIESEGYDYPRCTACVPKEIFTIK
jgi:hypothetical protein